MWVLKLTILLVGFFGLVFWQFFNSFFFFANGKWWVIVTFGSMTTWGALTIKLPAKRRKTTTSQVDLDRKRQQKAEEDSLHRIGRLHRNPPEVLYKTRRTKSAINS